MKWKDVEDDSTIHIQSLALTSVKRDRVMHSNFKYMWRYRFDETGDSIRIDHSGNEADIEFRAYFQFQIKFCHSAKPRSWRVYIRKRDGWTLNVNSSTLMSERLSAITAVPHRKFEREKPQIQRPTVSENCFTSFILTDLNHFCFFFPFYHLQIPRFVHINIQLINPWCESIRYHIILECLKKYRWISNHLQFND